MIALIDFSTSRQTAPAKVNFTGRATASRQAALEDALLVRRFNAGDQAAFIEIMDRHRDRILSVAWGMLRNHADAEEVAQDTFIRAHRGLAAFRGDASLATWLHRIALNLSRNRYWYFFRRCRHSSLSLDSSFSDGNQATFSDLVASAAASPAREAAVREFSDLVRDCMQQLGPKPREILTLRNSLNRSYDEIARELGISVGTVKSRIARARESLLLLLVGACPEFGEDAKPSAWFEGERPGGAIQVACA